MTLETANETIITPSPHGAPLKGDLTNGSIGRHLMRLSLPMVWGIFAIISFQLVNIFYISRLGTNYLAAVSFTFPVTMIVHNISVAMMVATSSVVARQIGQGNWLRVRRLTTHAIILGFIAGAIISIIGISSMDFVFRAMGASEEALAIIRDYLTIWFAGSILLTVPMVGNAAIRAAGDAMFPAVIMTISALINVILDPILIFGLLGAPALGVKGAAIANVIAYSVTLFAGLYVLRYKKNMISARFISLRLFGDSAKRLVSIAIPAGIAMMLPALAGLFIVRMLSGFGESAVAGYGINMRVEAFAFIPIMALATGMAPIIGQNWGAGRLARVSETVRLAIIFCIAWSAFVAVVIGLLAPLLGEVFSKGDAAITKNVCLYFWIVLPSLILGNLLQGWASTFNAIGKPARSFVMIFIRSVILTVPLAWLGAHYYGLIGLFSGIAIANVVSGLGAHIFSRKLCSQQKPAPQAVMA